MIRYLQTIHSFNPTQTGKVFRKLARLNEEKRKEIAPTNTKEWERRQTGQFLYGFYLQRINKKEET